MQMKLAFDFVVSERNVDGHEAMLVVFGTSAHFLLFWIDSRTLHWGFIQPG